jgi:hypothetical protein
MHFRLKYELPTVPSDARLRGAPAQRSLRLGLGRVAIRTMVMATATHTDMDTEMATRMGGTTTTITAAQATKTAIPSIREWPSCNADLRGPGITLALSMESWARRPAVQFALTSATMGIQANRRHNRVRGDKPSDFSVLGRRSSFGPVAYVVSPIGVITSSLQSSMQSFQPIT